MSTSIAIVPEIPAYMKARFGNPDMPLFIEDVKKLNDIKEVEGTYYVFLFIFSS
jgi:hypothetical protein